MRNINLRYVYDDVYKEDFIVAVDDEIYKLLKKRETEYKSVSTITMQDNNKLSNDDIDDLYDKLAELPLKQQNRIYEVFILGFTKTDVARIESCSEGAIRKSIARGLAQLRRKLV